ncbi:maleylpyruvate isomerase family mycothiol-dependent enzyme [Actinokineospora sp. HUAS TT18]|uniref:maleylpyruvate isomerase family mycothiol-dependent enzyme n=1 Tax=Actinokineospora sp. HUAS TT18 TaxID=3447451 RepID=UPI003F51F3FD
MTLAPEVYGRLLRTERDALLPILRRTPGEAFDRPTVCDLWSVRDVIAHCATALTRVATGTAHDFSPEDNQADVDAKRHLAIPELLSELEAAYELGAASPEIFRVALGEWVHGGDIREALGEPGAYASEGADDALILLEQRSRIREAPPTDVTLADGRTLRLGDPDADREAELETDVEGLFRIVANRRPELAVAELTGVTIKELKLFS